MPQNVQHVMSVDCILFHWVKKKNILFELLLVNVEHRSYMEKNVSKDKAFYCNHGTLLKLIKKTEKKVRKEKCFVSAI